MANIFDQARDAAASVATGLICPIFNSTPVNTASAVAARINGGASAVRDALTGVCGQPSPAPQPAPPQNCGVPGGAYAVETYAYYVGFSENIQDRRNFNGPATTSTVDIGNGITRIDFNGPNGSYAFGRYGADTRPQFAGLNYRYQVIDLGTNLVVDECAIPAEGSYPPLTEGDVTNINNFIEINNVYNFIGGSTGEDKDCPSPCDDTAAKAAVAAIAVLAAAQTAAFTAQTAALTAFSTATAASLVGLGVTLNVVKADTGYIVGVVNLINQIVSGLATTLNAIKNDVDDIEAVVDLTFEGLGLDGQTEYPGRDNQSLRNAREFFYDIIDRIGYSDSQAKLPVLNEEQDSSSVEKLLAILYTHEGVEEGLKERQDDGTFDEPYISVVQALQDIRDTPVQPVVVQGWEVRAPRTTSARFHYARKAMSKSQDLRVEIPSFDIEYTFENLPPSLLTLTRGDAFCRLEFKDGSSIQAWLPDNAESEAKLSSFASLTTVDREDEQYSVRKGGKNKPPLYQGTVFYLHTIEIIEPQEEGFKRVVLRLPRASS